MKRVMQRAWTIVRTLIGDLRAKLSVALKQAWAEYRGEIISVYEVDAIIDNALSEHYSNVRAFKACIGDELEITYNNISYNRGRRVETRVAYVRLYSDGKIEIVHDRAKIIYDLLKNKKVRGVMTREERRQNYLMNNPTAKGIRNIRII